MVSASSGSNNTSVILGDILKLHSDVQTTVVIQPNTWVTGVLRPGNAPYTLLNIITKPGKFLRFVTGDYTLRNVTSPFGHFYLGWTILIRTLKNHTSKPI